MDACTARGRCGPASSGGSLGTILLAILTVSLVVIGTRPEPITGAEAMAHNVGTHLAETWDQPEATRAYVGEVRDVTGFDVQPRARPAQAPAARARRVARAAAPSCPENPQHIFIPVVRGGTLDGRARDGEVRPPPGAWPWWRLVLALVLVFAVLSLMAGRVANLTRAAPRAARARGRPLRRRRPRLPHRRRPRAPALGRARGARRGGQLQPHGRPRRGHGARPAELLGAISHELRSPLGRARSRSRSRATASRRPSRRATASAPRRAPSTTSRGSSAASTHILGDLLDVDPHRASPTCARRRGHSSAWLRARVAEEPSPRAVRRRRRCRGPRRWPSTSTPAPRARRPQPARQRARARPSRRDRAPRGHRHPRAGAIAARRSSRDRGPGFRDGLRRARLRALRARRRVARAAYRRGAGYGLGLALVRAHRRGARRPRLRAERRPARSGRRRGRGRVRPARTRTVRRRSAPRPSSGGGADRIFLIASRGIAWSSARRRLRSVRLLQRPRAETCAVRAVPGARASPHRQASAAAQARPAAESAGRLLFEQDVLKPRRVPVDPRAPACLRRVPRPAARRDERRRLPSRAPSSATVRAQGVESAVSSAGRWRPTRGSPRRCAWGRPARRAVSGGADGSSQELRLQVVLDARCPWGTSSAGGAARPSRRRS